MNCKDCIHNDCGNKLEIFHLAVAKGRVNTWAINEGYLSEDDMADFCIDYRSGGYGKLKPKEEESWLKQ